MPSVNVEGVGVVNFPDSMSQKDIIRAIENDILPFAQTTPPKPEGIPTAPSTMRDIGVAGSTAAVGALKSIVDIFGADNPISQALASGQTNLQSLYTPERQKEIQYYNNLQQEAAKRGDILGEISAVAQGVKAAPLQQTVQAVSSIIPNLATLLIPVAGEARALQLSRNAINLAIGIAEGTGSAKGSIYEGVKQELIKNGVDEATASKKAAEAQSYLGENADQILGGAALGYAVGKYGVEQILSGKVTGLARKGAAVGSEFVTEGLQGAQQQVAPNVALQRQGFDVPTFQGVAGAAAQEAILGGLGAGVASGYGPRPLLKDVPDARPVEESQIPLLLEGKGAFTPVGLPDGSVAMTREDLARYEEEQFQKKYAPQTAEGYVPEVAPEPTPEPKPTDAGLNYATATQEIELLKRQPRTEESAARIKELQQYKLDTLNDSINAARIPVSPELKAIREQMERGDMTYEGQQRALDQMLAEYYASPKGFKGIEKTGAPKTELDLELADLQKEAKVLSADYKKLSSGNVTTSLKNEIKGLLLPEEVVSEIGTEKQFKYLAAPKGKRGTSIADLVGDGVLDKYLPPDMRTTSDVFDNQTSEEYIKELLRNADFAPYDAKNNARIIGDKLNELDARIKEITEPQLRLQELSQEEISAETEQLAREAGYSAAPTPQEVLAQEEYYPDMQEAEQPSEVDYERPATDFAAPVSTDRSSNIPVGEAAAPVQVPPAQEAEGQGAAENAERVEPPRYQEAAPGERGMEKAMVDSVVNTIKPTWKNAPEIEVVQSTSDLPTYLQQQMARDQVNPRGIFDPDAKKVYLVADNIGSKAQAAITLAHEALGHYGLRVVLGKNFTPMMNEIYAKNNAVRRRADAYIKDGLDKPTAVEEVLSEMAQEVYDTKVRPGDIRLSALQKVMNAVRQFLARLGVPMKTITNAEVLALIANARKSVVSGKKPTAEIYAGKVVYSKKEQPKARKTSGAAAMDILAQMERGVEPPPPGYKERMRNTWDNARENPKATAQSAKSAFTKFADKMETVVFSSDAALNNNIRRAVDASTKGLEEKIGYLLETSLSQTVHADAIANLLLMDGKVSYDKGLHKWKSEKVEDNLVSLARQLDEIADKHGLTKEEAQLVAHTAFEAKRLRGLSERNKSLPGKIEDLMQQASKAAKSGDAKKAAELRNSAKNLQGTEKFIHMTDEQIANGMKLFQTIPELSDLVKTWQGMRKNTMDAIVEGGLWSREEADELLSNIDYVPFYRVEQIEEGAGPREFIRGLQVRARDPKMKGSSKPVNDVFDNMARWMQYAVNRSVRNRSAVALADAAVESGLGTKVAEPVRGANNVNVWRDGKQEHFVMEDPLYMDAFKGLEAISIPSIKFFSKMSNILRQSVVMYPLFSVAQVPQDAFAAMFSSGLKARYALRIPALAAKEFLQSLRKKSSTHEVLRKIGAVGVRDFSSSTARLDAEIYSGLKAPPGVLGKIKSSLNHIAMAADNAVRQATYEAAIAQGLSQAEAMEKAFQLINFRARGSSKMLALAGQVIPFFNAYLAAQHVAYKTITGKGISPQERGEALKTLAATTGSVMTLSLIYAMMNADDDDYKNKPAAVRDRLLMIPGTGMSIPLRMDLFTIPKVITEHMYLMMTDKGYEDGRKFRDSMKNALGNAILSPTLVPQAIKPLVEVGINYDFFQGRPLIGTYQKGLETERQFNDSTSELAKLFGSTGLVSPIAADHLIRGMFGSVGGLAVFMTNPILHSDPEVERPEMSLKEMMAALPGTSGFITKDFENALKSDFYVLRDEVSKVANTVNDMKARSPDELDKYLDQPGVFEKLALQRTVNQVTQDLTKIRRAISYITNAPSSEFSAAEKREQIRELRQMERELLEGVNVKELRSMAGL